MTQTGMVMGTPAYMSPEQGSGEGNRIDGRSDIYSLGVMMYQLAVGKLPFPGSNFGEVLIGHLQQAPPPPRSLKPEIPEEFEKIILKCLEKQQENRFQSMKELKHAVEACMDALGISKELPQADETDPELQPVEGGRPSSPGMRTPGRPTGPISKNRISNPNARASKPGVRTSNPSLRGSQPGARQSRPPGQGTQPPQAPSRLGLFVGIGVAAVVVIAVAIFLIVRSVDNKAELAAKDAAVKAAKIAAAEKAAKAEEDEAPVFLSVVSGAI